MVEVAEVRELVAERRDQARVAERLPGNDVSEADADGAVAIADAVTASHPGRLRLDDSVAEPEVVRDDDGVAVEARHQLGP